MPNSLKTLQVIITGNASGLTKTAKQATSSIHSMQTKMKDFVKHAQVMAGIKAPTAEYKKLSNDIQQAQAQADQLNKALAAADNIKYVKSDKYAKLESELAGAEAALKKLEDTEKEWQAQGKDTSALNGPIMKYYEKTTKIMAQMNAMMANGTDMTISKPYQDLANQAAKANKNLADLKSKMSSLKASGKDLTDGILTKSIKSIGSGMTKAMSTLTGGIKKSGGAFASLIQKFKTSGSSMANPFKAGLSSALKYVLGLSALKKAFDFVKKGIQEGMTNLSKYSQTTRDNLYSLKDGLNTVKNSLASAFSPILSVIAPILNSLMDMLIDAMNTVSAFFAALTGASTYTAAVRGATAYGDAVGGAADSADKAASANEKLKRSLMGFDIVNKLDDNSSSGSGGSGGSGGGGGGGGAGAGFTTQQVSTGAQNFADMVKEAWNKADFTEIGGIVGQKLKDALDSIPWDTIKETCNKVAKSLATFINGFVGTQGLGTSIGNTIGEAFNTAIGMANTFVHTLDWEGIGKFIADTINGAVSKFDWKAAADTLSTFAKGLFNTISTAIGEVDWKAIGTSIGKFIASIDWIGVLKSAAKALINAFVGLFEFGEGLFTAIKDGVSNVDWKQVAEDMWKSLKTSWKNAISGTTLEKVGTALSNTASDVASWFSDIKTWWSNAKSGGLSKVSVAMSTGKVAVTAWFSKIQSYWKTAKKAGLTKLTVALATGAKNVRNWFTNIRSWWSKAKSGGLAKLTVLMATGSKNVSTWFGNIKSWWINAKRNGLPKLKADIENNAKALWSKFKGWWDRAKGTLTVHVKEINTKSGSGNYASTGGRGSWAVGGVYQYGKWSELPQYANGATDLRSGSAFIAGEAGPEIVASARNGRSEVLNKSQIASAIYNAVLTAMMQSGGGNGGRGDIYVYVGGKQVTDVVIKEVNQRTRATGSCPIYT